MDKKQHLFFYISPLKKYFDFNEIRQRLFLGYRRDTEPCRTNAELGRKGGVINFKLGRGDERPELRRS